MHKALYLNDISNIDLNQNWEASRPADTTYAPQSAAPSKTKFSKIDISNKLQWIGQRRSVLQFRQHEAIWYI